MRRRLSVSHPSRLVVAGLVSGGLVVACAGSAGSGFGDGGAGSGTKKADASITSPPGTTDGSSGTDSGSISLPVGTHDAQSGQKADASCGGTVTKAQQSPLDIYIMLDQSGSMQGNPWNEVTSAIESFVSQPLSGVSVGLQYFGLPAAGGGGYGGNDSCVVSDYATPSVEIAALPGVASAIQTSIKAHSPSSMTPTGVALQGAVNHCQSWATAHPGHVVVALLATDGEPNECTGGTIAGVESVAAAGLSGTPKVLTFVIGVNDSGTSLSNLNGIAAAGGTTSAFMVTTGTGAATTAFLAALNKIRGSALGCQYAIPPAEGGIPDYGKVNVVYTPSSGTKETVPNVTNAAACPSSGDAWYYDNNQSPTEILLCSSTCTKVQADSSGEVSVVVGCATIISTSK
jgi:hypothetical protein